ncbi:MAG: hypothetical protein JRG95_08770 [Deltaproteobacteria bacterium]|nr:hypothetical protein [Deltaproteobacteria bacterium]
MVDRSREPLRLSRAEADEATTRTELVADVAGDATVCTYTVEYEGAHPTRAIALCEFEPGRRTLAVTEDSDLASEMTREEFGRRPVRIHENGTFS